MSKRVLIAPLHWGLGHATRCVPIIREQLKLGNEVIISANSGPRKLIEAQFPSLTFVDIPFMEITYPKDGNMVGHFFWQGPKLIHSIWREHQMLKRIIQTEKIDLVISDSRFGLWSKKVKSIFITHQVQILSPRFQWVINLLNRWIMSKYDEVWIPDYEQAPGLAGVLSHPVNLPKHVKYIGPKSRFNDPLERVDVKYKNLGIASGPEPQRSLFEAELARRFIESDEVSLLLRGKPNENDIKDIGKLKIVPHLKDDAFLAALSQSEKVICRSGYSTIMDLHILGVKAEFHPTPGQTEQEYLAGLHTKMD